MKKMTVGSFFAGVGGIDLGFEQTGNFKVVYANEIDEYPIKTYEANFKLTVDKKDISDVKGSEIPDFDVMIGGFPCQAFSLAGYRQGFDDEKGRGTLFFELVRIIREKKAINKQPQIVFFENVKNLVGHDNGNTFRVILELLEGLGYKVEQQVLNACEYGNVPQNRERIYIVGFLDETVYNKFKFPKPQALETKIQDIVDFENKVDEKYYYTAENCSFYDILKENMKRSDTIYQWRRVYVRENKSNVCPTLTANMGTGGHNVPMIKCKTGIRKLTPKECFNIQGFPRDYIIPDDMSNTRAYKQAGNSVVVPVIKRIADEILKAML
ncbi:DNA cytosine methyltransferase [uncultured Eubacterium sp.]|uniref:DNA cytosine methyltransferase n=1 Tax=uncultured Eubacterium sp. TaxID=165185 RepID=UPI00280575C7|nr:DNA cytosine methyltransferase [uncultured Eubacterium sp.]